MADKTDEKKTEAKGRVVVTLAELREKYGDEKGNAKYSEIAQVVNGGNPLSLAPDLNQYAPDIAIHSEVRSKVEAILG